MRESHALVIELAAKSPLRGIVGDLVRPEPIVLSDDASVDRWVRRHVRTSPPLFSARRFGCFVRR